MTVPNVGPEQFDQGDPGSPDGGRRGNPAPLLRDEPITDEVAAASARASAVTHRFGGVRYALTRTHTAVEDPLPPVEEGGPESA